MFMSKWDLCAEIAIGGNTKTIIRWVYINAIFKYFWTIGGILDFQIMGREDLCFESWNFNLVQIYLNMAYIRNSGLQYFTLKL
jgi:hypothetical protein